MPDPTDTPTGLASPIIVSPSSIPAQLAAACRILTVLIAGSTAILGFLSSHDLAGLWIWLHTTEAAPFIAAVVAVATFAYSLYVTWRRHGKLFTVTLWAKAGEAAPDSVVQLK